MYIKNTIDGKLPKIEDGLKQTFKYKAISNVSRDVIAKDKEEGIFNDRDLEICKFLFKFRFATVEQIYQYLKLKGFIKRTETEDGEIRETSVTSVKARLDKLVKYKILNKFMLGKAKFDRMEEDSFQIYCLFLGGRYLLGNFSNEDTSNWYLSENLQSSSHISKDLTVTNIYLKILEACGDRLINFEKTPLRKCDKLNILPTFDFSVSFLGTKKYFICENIKEIDTFEFSKKALKLESLLTTNAWRKYYIDSQTPPILLLFGESDIEALDSSRIISRQTEIKDFRASTEELVMNDLTVFLKYIEEKDAFQRVKVNIFSKE